MRRLGFTLTELLVAIAIILVMLAAASAAVSAARTSGRVNSTRTLIMRLDQVLTQQYSTYASRAAPGFADPAARAAYLRNLVSAEMPDSWEDIRLVATGSAGIPLTAPQLVYKGIWDNLPATAKDPSPANNQYVGKFNGDAECLFLIVMRSGIADCLACTDLTRSQIGDADELPDGTPVPDGMPEFLDAWGKPIRYVLWPAGLRMPANSGKYFSATLPFSSVTPVPAKGGIMRPLIFSLGPDRRGSTAVNDGNNLTANLAVVNFGGWDNASPDGRADNITNFDEEAKP